MAEKKGRELKALGENMEKVFEGTTGALSTLLGKEVSFKIEGTSSIAEPPVVQREPKKVVAEVQLSGNAKGKCLLLCEEGDALRLVDFLMGGDGAAKGEVGAEQADALNELVNQASGAATAAMGSIMGIQCTHSVQKVFVLTPESVEAFNNSLDYPVLKMDWSMVVGEVPIAVEQLIERRLFTGLMSHPGEDSRGAAPAGEPAAAGPVPEAQAAAAQVEVTPEEISKLLKSAPVEAPPAARARVAAGGAARRGADALVESSTRKGGKAVVQSHEFPEIQDTGLMPEPRKLDMLLDVPLHLTVELGRTKRLVKEILQLGPGSVLELDKLAGEAVDVLVNGRLLAKAEVVVIDENFGVRITEIISRSDRLKDLKQQ